MASEFTRAFIERIGRWMTSALDRAVEDYETGVSYEEAENKADFESIDLIREIEGVRKLGLLTKAEEEI